MFLDAESIASKTKMLTSCSYLLTKMCVCVVDMMQHFFASIDKAKSVLGWKPEYDLVEGLADSYNLDFGRGTFRKEADFSTDDIILGKSLVLQS